MADGFWNTAGWRPTVAAAGMSILLVATACGDDDGGSITAEAFCADYRAAQGDGLNWMLDWMDDNGNDPVRAATRAYRFARSTCPSILEDGVLDAWFAELGLDPDLPPIAEQQAPEPTS